MVLPSRLGGGRRSWVCIFENWQKQATYVLDMGLLVVVAMVDWRLAPSPPMMS